MSGKFYKGIQVGLAVVAFVMAGEFPTWAASGGEGNNTGCNGQGNPNSPCQPGEGQHGHPSVINHNNTDIHNRNYNKVTSTNVNVNENSYTGINTSVNSLQGGASTSQAEGYVGGTYDNTIQGDTVKVYAPAPSAFAPALTSAPETCFGSTSAGASGGNGIFGFGLSFGTTWKSDDCELRMFARSLQSLGENKAALALLAQNEKVAAALKEATGAGNK